MPRHSRLGSLVPLSAEKSDPSTVPNAGVCRLPPWTWPVAISVLAWAVIFIAVPPAKQDFPLNDDWAFARGAIWFAHGEGIHYCNWASMPQIGQWLWSSPFFLLTNLPHFDLRISTIVLSWVGLAAFYDLLCQLGIPSRLSGLAACVLAMNPLFFICSGTYMTDVPALSFGLIAMSGYCRAIRGKNERWLAAAFILAILACITRQNMVSVPVAAGLVLWQHREIRFKPAWLLSVFVPVAAGLAVSLWFARRPDVQPMKIAVDWSDLAFRCFMTLHLCGLAALPLCFLLSKREFSARTGLVLILALIMMAAMLGYINMFGVSDPFSTSFPYGIGILTKWGTYGGGFVAGTREILLTPGIRAGLDLLGCAGGALIVTLFLMALRDRRLPGILFIFCGLQIPFMLTLPYLMDRYIMVLFPGVLYLMASQFSRCQSGWWMGRAAICVSGLISVALMHDLLSWNAARWELGRKAVAEDHLNPGDIEGGFEWNGWYASTDPGHADLVPGAERPFNDYPGLNLEVDRYLFPKLTGKYALAFCPVENSLVVGSNQYAQWLPPAQKKFFLLQYRPEK